MTACADCDALAGLDNPRCSYHDLITGGGASPMRQALAVTIAPVSFEKIAASFEYFRINGPTRPRKFGPWEEREIWAAYEAADRVAVLVGWTV